MNWSRIEDLIVEVGREAFDEVVALFVQEADEIIARLLGAHDRENLAGDLHFLKGAALNLGFAETATLCQDAEQALPLCDAIEVGVGRVVDSYETSKAALLSGLKSWQDVA